MRRNKIPYSLVVSLLVAVVPVLAGLLYAAGYSAGLTGVLAHGFTTQYWRDVLGDGSFWYSLAFSLYIAICSVIISAALAVMLALHYRRRWLSGGRRLAISLPLVFPSIVVAYLLVQWCSKAGILSRLAFAAGFLHDLHAFPDMINDRAGIGIITAQVLMTAPFFTLLFAGIYADARLDAYQQVSAGLGATQSQFFRKVALPLLFRQSLPTLVLYVIFAMGAYEVPLLLGRSYPQMVSVYTTDKLSRFDLFNKPKAYVAALVFTALVMSLLTHVFRLRKRNIA